MTQSQYPASFLSVNNQQSKQVNIVVSIEGVPEYFVFMDLYTRVRYGDPDLVYGMPGLIYGGLKRVSNTLDYLTLDGSLSITQRLEVEQGRSSVSTFTVVLIDKDNYITSLCAPGVAIDELLGNKQVRIFMGFQNTSFPEDYFTVFRGSVAGTIIQGPKVTLQLADANQDKRSTIFDIGATKTTAAITDTDTTVPVVSTNLFYKPIVGPNLSVYPLARTLIKVEDEFMRYDSFTDTSIHISQRNAAPFSYTATGAVAHDIDATVTPAIELGPENAITMALMIMLSGWNGPWTTGESIRALGTSLSPFNTARNILLLPSIKDSVEDYGLVTGDYIYVVGSGAGNDGTYTVVSTDSDFAGLPNRIIYLDRNLTPEPSTSATFSIRSKYDVLPTACALGLKPIQVDVATHEYIRDNYLNGTEVNFAFTMLDKISAKEFIEQNLFFPLGCYSLTRFGRLSIGYTRPPVLIYDKLVTLDETNVTNPNNIIWTRALNNRRFYNQITFNYDYDSTNDAFTSVTQFLDTDSLNKIGQASSMSIDAKGASTAQGAQSLAENTARRMLERFKNAAYEVQIEASFGAGVLIEAGDIVCVKDNGNLQIPSVYTGQRNIGETLFEVVDRALDIKSGTTKLKLLSGIFDSRSDRYGVIGPSSRITSATTTRITVSGLNESDKWTDHIDQPVRIYSIDFTYYHETVLRGFDPENQNIFLVDELPVAPSAGFWFDIPKYASTDNKEDMQLYKALYGFLSKVSLVTSGVSSTSFNVSDTESILPGSLIEVHKIDYTVDSGDNGNTVDTVAGSLVTVKKDLGHTPVSGEQVDLLGFPDTQPTYRIF